MKKHIVFLLAFIVLVSCQKQNYTLNADTSIIFQNDSVVESVDSAWLMCNAEQIGDKVPIVDGKIILSGQIEEPVYAQLCILMTLKSSDKKTGEKIRIKATRKIPLIVEPGNIFIKKSAPMFTASGTPLNDDLYTAHELFLQQCKSLDSAKQVIIDYVVAHKNDISVAYMLRVMGSLLSENELIELINQCSNKIQSNNVISELKENAELLLQAPQEGDMYKDFEVEYEGQTFRLSDYVGKGQYVLADFWASWCQPCRKEVPNLIAAYEKYNDKGLVVLGIASWDQPENTLKAIAEDGIKYPQILNTQDVATKIYGIKGIPEIILFAPDGKIVKRGLRGAAIEEKLNEIYK